jgi:hypothetical protein
MVITATGFMVGLGIGAATVGYATGLGSLVIQGAICGLAVGVAQALVRRIRIGLLTLAWRPALAAIWANGWAVTTSIGVQVDLQFAVFGSAGAIVVTGLTAVLTLNRYRDVARPEHPSSTSPADATRRRQGAVRGRPREMVDAAPRQRGRS